MMAKKINYKEGSIMKGIILAGGSGTHLYCAIAGR